MGLLKVPLINNNNEKFPVQASTVDKYGVNNSNLSNCPVIIKSIGSSLILNSSESIKFKLIGITPDAVYSPFLVNKFILFKYKLEFS